MEGTIEKILPDKGFGFIKGPGGIEYFFHRSDFNGFWDDLKKDFILERLIPINVTFEETYSDRGPRAKDVRRTDFPNQAV